MRSIRWSANCGWPGADWLSIGADVGEDVADGGGFGFDDVRADEVADLRVQQLDPAGQHGLCVTAGDELFGQLDEPGFVECVELFVGEESLHERVGTATKAATTGGRCALGQGAAGQVAEVGKGELGAVSVVCYWETHRASCPEAGRWFEAVGQVGGRTTPTAGKAHATAEGEVDVPRDDGELAGVRVPPKIGVVPGSVDERLTRLSRAALLRAQREAICRSISRL